MEEIMKIDKMTEEEKLIEDDIESLRVVSKSKKDKINKIILRARKNRAISLRIANFDLEKIKEKANNDGIPYQTLINTILHKYITNQLYEKEEIIKSLKIINAIKAR
ncbi:hypothetical protein ES705_36815 [subsurface metagenome]